MIYIFIKFVCWFIKSFDSITESIRIGRMSYFNRKWKGKWMIICGNILSMSMISFSHLFNNYIRIIINQLNIFLPEIHHEINIDDYIDVVCGLTGLNEMTTKISNKKEEIIDYIDGNEIIYCLRGNKLCIEETDNILIRESIQRKTEKMFTRNIEKLKKRNSEIYRIGMTTLPPNGAVMRLIKEICLETYCDVLLGRKVDINCKYISTLEKFDKEMIIAKKGIINFHYYKYCEQINIILKGIIEEYKENNIEDFDKCKIENFLEITRHTFGSNDMTIDDVLMGIIFNVIEYSMNKIFSEYYWEYQKIFPVKMNGRMIVIDNSQHIGSEFINKRMRNVIGEETMIKFYRMMYIVYEKMKNEDLEFVECVNPERMMGYVL
jgi:hypothetical protein